MQRPSRGARLAEKIIYSMNKEKSADVAYACTLVVAYAMTQTDAPLNQVDEAVDKMTDHIKHLVREARALKGQRS